MLKLPEKKYPPCPALKTWLDTATPMMSQKLALLAQTSAAMFRQWVPGRRGVSADTAGRLARASVRIAKEDPKAPKPLKRGDLCAACRECEYYKAGSKVVIQEDDFDIV